MFVICRHGIKHGALACPAGLSNIFLGALTRLLIKHFKHAEEHMLMASGGNSWSYSFPSLVPQILMTGNILAWKNVYMRTC